MKNNKKYNTLALTLVLGLALAAPAEAAGEMLVPVGQAVGIELRCRGVVVTGFAEVETASGAACPARAAGLRAGDVITALDGRAVTEGRDFLEKAASFTDEPVRLGVTRAGQPLEVTVHPEQNLQGGWQLGLWLRDSIQGIGTVTWYDPATGEFGALGHGVSLPEGSGLADISGGTVTAALVTDVLPGRAGEPGELCGLPGGEPLGSVDRNTALGIFGEGTFDGGEALPVASDSEIRPGDAAILATVDGGGPRRFSARILRVDRSGGMTRQLTSRSPIRGCSRAPGGSSRA